MLYDLSICIVTYKTNLDILKKAIDSCLSSKLNILLYIYDNSPTNQIYSLVKKNTHIVYIHNARNVGFAKAHNAVIDKIINKSKYHLVLNPDVYFEKGVLENLYAFMEDNKDIGLVMPKVLYPDGSLQYLCRYLPSPFELFARRFFHKFFRTVFRKRMDELEFRHTTYNEIMDVPFLSGSFMFIRTEVFRKVGKFDEKFFLYFEDMDFCRRIYKKYRTVYYPRVKVYHYFARDSYKDNHILLHHIQSAIYYFKKWGWFFDSERKKINKEIDFRNRHIKKVKI